MHEAERQRDALLPQLRSLTEDLRRVQVSVSVCLCVFVYLCMHACPHRRPLARSSVRFTCLSVCMYVCEQELGLEQKLRDSLVRVSDAEYQQSLLDAQVSVVVLPSFSVLL